MDMGEIRVVDPILSEHARGYSQDGYIGDELMPLVSMPTRAAKRIEFDRSSFRRPKIIRAPGSRIAQIEVGYEGKPVALIQRALGAKTPVEHMEEAQKVPGIDLLTEGVNTVLNVIALDREISQAEAARNPAAYAATNKTALAGPDKWSDPASKPDELVNDAKEVIRKRTGRRPNTLAIGAEPASKLRVHPRVKDHFKHTTAATISDEMLATFFNVKKVLVGDMIYDDDDNASFDVWGEDAILAYVPAPGQRGMRVPAFGYTYRLRGHPFVEPAYFERSVRSWMNDCFDEWSPELVGADAGFLIQDAV
ncbi:MAG TPA: hypothetical protein VF605_11735 [Allosphingosinicella sp.]|jgi:hypothetical protein